MSGFTKIKEGTVKIEHFSTSSGIKITFKHQEQKKPTRRYGRNCNGTMV